MQYIRTPVSVRVVRLTSCAITRLHLGVVFLVQQYSSTGKIHTLLYSSVPKFKIQWSPLILVLRETGEHNTLTSLGN